ncbi:MAG TPA: LptA/OstA family protein [Caulobacteraceae bacterium]|jgi:lipopolysaccharide export system protein LptA|nr:LptA/OstA family protein [Caulobacteraceae bacterium]
MSSRTSTSSFAAALAAAVLAGAGGPAAAQLEKSNAPIDITADQAEVVQSKCMAVWKGSAEAVQARARLRADVITVYSRIKGGHGTGPDSASCGPTERIEAEGHVYYVTPERTARGDRAVYSQAADQIVMTGDVIVVQGQDVARGDKLIIDVSNRQARMVSGGAGGSGRVRGVYFPDQQPSSGGTPPSPAAPQP